jgi:hypothetical protein
MIGSQNRAPGDGARRPLFGLQPLNLVLLGLAVVTVAVGYVLLGRGSTVAAPLLLVLGYAGLIPAGLLVGLRREAGSDSEPGE